MNEYGLSKSIVEKNFPEPELARNPHYACAAPMKLWTEAQIKRALKKKAVVESLSTLQSSAVSNAARYRTRTIPAAGALLKPEDQGQQQLMLDI